MLYRKSYSYGLLGNKGTSNLATKIFGGAKNAGIDFAQGYYHKRIVPEVEKQLTNYLEKSFSK